MSDQELEHFGIKGMKWGVRRTPAQLGHRKEKTLNRYKEKEIRKVEKRIASDKETENQKRYGFRTRKKKKLARK